MVNYIAKQEIIHFLTMCFGKCWLGVLTKTFCHQRLIMEKQNNQIANTLFKIMVRLRVATCSAKFEAPFYDIRDVNNIQWRTKVRNLIVSIETISRCNSIPMMWRSVIKSKNSWRRGLIDYKSRTAWYYLYYNRDIFRI